MAPMKNSKKVKRVVVAATASAAQARAKKRSRSSDDDSSDAANESDAKRRKQDMGADDSSTSTQHQQTKRGVKRPLTDEDDIPLKPITNKLRKTTPTQSVVVVNKNKKAVSASFDDNDAILPSVADTTVPDVSNKNIEKKNETLVNLNGAFKSRDTFKALRKQMQVRHEYMRQCRAVTISSRDYWTPNTEYTRFDGRKFTIRRPSDWLPGTEYNPLLAGKSAADANIPVSSLKLWHQTMELHREKKLTNSNEDSNKIDPHQHPTGSNFNNPMMKLRFGELPVLTQCLNGWNPLNNFYY